MIKLKNYVFQNTQFTETITKINNSENLPVKTAYWINKLTKELADRAKDYEEIRIKLLEKHGNEQVDEEGNSTGSYHIEKENMDVFTTDFTELLEQEFEMSLKKAEYPEELSLTPLQLGLVEDIFNLENLLD